MAIEIEIDANPETDNKKREAKSENITFKMNARRSLDGNIMIMFLTDFELTVNARFRDSAKIGAGRSIVP